MVLVKEDLPRRHNMYKNKQIPLCLHKFWTQVYVVLWWFQCWEDREYAVQYVMVVCYKVAQKPSIPFILSILFHFLLRPAIYRC